MCVHTWNLKFCTEIDFEQSCAIPIASTDFVIQKISVLVLKVLTFLYLP